MMAVDSMAEAASAYPQLRYLAPVGSLKPVRQVDEESIGPESCGGFGAVVHHPLDRLLAATATLL